MLSLLAKARGAGTPVRPADKCPVVEAGQQGPLGVIRVGLHSLTLCPHAQAVELG